MSAATAAAEPPDEPPGTLFKFHGLCVICIAEFSVELPIANSSMFSFPKLIISCSFSSSTTVASYGATKFSSILDAHVVFTPFVHRLSFIPIGTPAKLDFAPLFLSSSTLTASFSASSKVVVIKAFTSFSLSSILAL